MRSKLKHISYMVTFVNNSSLKNSSSTRFNIQYYLSNISYNIHKHQDITRIFYDEHLKPTLQYKYCKSNMGDR